jgi:hypothetical protein
MEEVSIDKTVNLTTEFDEFFRCQNLQGYTCLLMVCAQLISGLNLIKSLDLPGVGKALLKMRYRGSKLKESRYGYCND